MAPSDPTRSLAQRPGDAPSGLQQRVGAISGMSVWPYSLQPRSDAALANQTIIVTGGNTGIGFESVKAFLQQGAGRVIIGIRKDAKGEPTWDETLRSLKAGPKGMYEGKVEIWDVDYSSLDSVRRFAKRWNLEEKPLDVLVGNIGIAVGDRAKTKDGFELHYEINYLSHFVFCLLVLPSIKRSPSARIIHVASCLHWLGGAINWRDHNNDEATELQWMRGYYLVAYGRAKLFLVMFTKELQERLDAAGASHVICQAVHPGHVATPIYTRYFRRSEMFSHPTGIIRAFIILVFLAVAISIKHGAKAIIKAAVSDEDDRSVRGGRYWNRGFEQVPRSEVRDPVLRAKLWERSRLHGQLKDGEGEV